ncbi:MAG: hypothetical protein ACI3YT_06545 [Prevotella sp.]
MIQYRKRYLLFSGVLAALVCMFTACASVSSSDDSVNTSSSESTVSSPSDSASADTDIEQSDSKGITTPVSTGFTTLTREGYSTLGCGGEQGYYELHFDESIGTNIFYIDYATQQEVYLCAAPNCTHDHEGCTAWIDADEGSYIPLVNGDHLLLVHITYGSEAPERAIPHIDVANLDGSSRHTLVEFEANERLKSVFAANGNQLVCALDEVNPDDIEDSNATLKLVLIDLDTGERTDFYERAVQIGGTEPVFMGVTENGYCALREQYTAKSEADFPGQEWTDIADEIERSTQYTCTIIPVGGAKPVGTLTYNGRIYDLLCDDGIYYFDCDSRKVTRLSLPDGTVTELATLPDDGATSAYLDGRMGDWFLLSQRYYEDRSGISYPVAIDCCYAVNVQNGEVRSLDIRQEVGADRRMATMLGKNSVDVLLISDSEVPDTATHYGFVYSLISQEDYLNSNAAGLKAIQFAF